MPYLPDVDRRDALDSGEAPQDGAELNYVISRHVDRFIESHGLSYHTLEEIDGCLGLAQHEFRRRVVKPYEDMKWMDNGEVFTFAYAELMARAQGRDPMSGARGE